MFFIVSKLLSFLFMPTSWLVISIVLMLIANKPQIKSLLLRFAIVVFIFFSNSFIFEEVMRLWEPCSSKKESMPEYEIGIVLGGMSDYDNFNERINFYGSIDRLLQAVDLYYDNKISKILITGGSGKLLDQKNREAIFLRDYMLKIGFPQRDLLIESESKNTRENAVNTGVLLAGGDYSGRLLLISSAWHLPRAKACFEKVGLSVDLYPTNRVAGPRRFDVEHILVPNAEALVGWNMFLHEIVGFMVYKLKGYV